MYITEAEEPLKALKNPYEATIYAVGGCVRDYILERDIKDVDLASALLPQTFKDICKKKGFKTIDVGIDHGTVTVEINGKYYEHTTFREDVYTDGRKAKVKFTSSLGSDALRRDFTMNSLYYKSPKMSQYLKEANHLLPNSHFEDIQEGIIRACGNNPDARFREDYLRIMRLLRFAIRYEDDMTIESKTLNAALGWAHNIKNHVSTERILEELFKAFSTRKEKYLWYLKNKELGVTIGKKVLGIDFSKTSLIWEPQTFKAFLIQILTINRDLITLLPITRKDEKAFNLLNSLLTVGPNKKEELWKRKNSFTSNIAADYFFGSPFYLTILEGEKEVERVTKDWPKHLTGKEIGVWQKKEFGKKFPI